MAWPRAGSATELVRHTATGSSPLGRQSHSDLRRVHGIVGLWVWGKRPNIQKQTSATKWLLRVRISTEIRVSRNIFRAGSHLASPGAHKLIEPRKNTSKNLEPHLRQPLPPVLNARPAKLLRTFGFFYPSPQASRASESPPAKRRVFWALASDVPCVRLPHPGVGNEKRKHVYSQTVRRGCRIWGSKFFCRCLTSFFGLRDPHDQIRLEKSCGIHNFSTKSEP